MQIPGNAKCAPFPAPWGPQTLVIHEFCVGALACPFPGLPSPPCQAASALGSCLPCPPDSDVSGLELAPRPGHREVPGECMRGAPAAPQTDTPSFLCPAQSLAGLCPVRKEFSFPSYPPPRTLQPLAQSTWSQPPQNSRKRPTVRSSQHQQLSCTLGREMAQSPRCKVLGLNLQHQKENRNTKNSLCLILVRALRAYFCFVLRITPDSFRESYGVARFS